MNIAFLTEMDFQGKIPIEHPNMRTEYAWMYALNATHIPIINFSSVSGFDYVFIIFPKGRVFLSAEGSRLIKQSNPVSILLESNIIDTLKQNNKKVVYMQEGPHWWFNNYEVSDQILFYNMLASCDAIFAHNEHDTKYYKGMFPTINVFVMPTLMIDYTIKDYLAVKEDKVIVGGNFSRWYGGFESYLIAQEFNVPIYTQTSHAKRDNEEQLIHHLPRLMWTEWMKVLGTFKYAVHLMPTIAAGTFNLNCAYFGIPCIGNEKVDTQRICFPELSVDVEDMQQARKLARLLVTDENFYNECSIKAKENYNMHYAENVWNKMIHSII